jgi:uncharacterized protein YfaS (alpha-2-macroglobulin family)
MTSIAQNNVEPGSTADLVARFTDTDGNRVDVDGTPTIDIVDPDGEKIVDADAMTEEKTGLWVYYWETPSDAHGTYRATVDADVDLTSGTRTERKSLRFEVTIR